MTSEPEHYELLILGGEEAGNYLAWTMSKAGLRCAVVERKLIGGSCPNTNCMPTKNEIWSAKVADLVRHADRFGSAPASTADSKRATLALKSVSTQFASKGFDCYHQEYRVVENRSSA